MKGHERRHDRQPRRTAERHRFEEVAAGMSLLEQGQNRIVDRFDGRRHEQAAGLAQARKQLAMPEQMFHLDRDVIGQRRVGGVQRLDNAERVRRPVEEIRVPERDVLRASGHLRGHIGEDDVGLHDTELTAIDRDHGAMPAQVTAPPARLGVADDPARPVAPL